MRRLVTTLLIAILAACPILCGTESHGHALQADSHDAAPQPVNDDCCSCNGALQVADAGQLGAALAIALLASIFLGPGVGLVRPPLTLAIPSWPGRAEGRASPAPLFRLLNVYRC